MSKEKNMLDRRCTQCGARPRDFENRQKQSVCPACLPIMEILEKIENKRKSRGKPKQSGGFIQESAYFINH